MCQCSFPVACVCVSEAGLDTDKKKRQMLFTTAFVVGVQNDDCLDALWPFYAWFTFTHDRENRLTVAV